MVTPCCSPTTSSSGIQRSRSSRLPRSLACLSLRDLGPARPAPAPRGFAAILLAGDRLEFGSVLGDPLCDLRDDWLGRARGGPVEGLPDSLGV